MNLPLKQKYLSFAQTIVEHRIFKTVLKETLLQKKNVGQRNDRRDDEAAFALSSQSRKYLFS